MNNFNDEWLINPLIKNGILTDKALKKLKANQQLQNISLYDNVVLNGFISEEKLNGMLSQIFHIPVVDIQSLSIDKKAVEILTANFCNKFTIFPFAVNPKYISVAVADPLNLEAENEIAFLSERLVKPYLCVKSQIEEKIKEYYNPDNYMEDYSSGLSDGAEIAETAFDEQESEHHEISNMSAPIVKLVNSLLNDAIDKAASDIHIEPIEKKLVIRFRMDGILKKMMEVPKYASAQLMARIKVISRLDVAETRKPQDGQTKLVRNGNVIDLRVSILPTSYGEKAVIRVLDSSKSNIPLEQLGITGENLKKLKQVLSLKQGIVLATGPTGSGKTSTLYAALNKMKSPDTNILTIEDPIEYTIQGINQVQVNNKAGITFATALRSFLRQDPDVILVGEIRDNETAEISIRAALTGHLVLSTIHTNNAIESITRLMDIGIDRYKVSSAVSAITAQRLVRKICPQCSQEAKPGNSERAIIPLFEQQKLSPKFFKGSGCIRCDFTGYKGRIGIYEVLILDDELREMINNGASMVNIEQAALKKGFRNFTMEALTMITSGITDFNEISRVIPFRNNPVAKEVIHQHSKEINKMDSEKVESRVQSYKSNASKRKILVVDDDNIMRRIVCSFLKKEDTYSVSEAVDGLEALQNISKDMPDLILLDILMPRMDGYEVCRNLRKDQQYSKIPIIMLSSLEDKEDLVKGFDLGIDDYISKPVEQKVLIARINALLRRSDYIVETVN